MPIIFEKKSLQRYSLLIFLILILFVCAIFFYIRTEKGKELTNDIKQLTELNEDYSAIDSCIIALYKADNNSRLYTATGKKIYIQQFVKDINFVSNALSEINNRSNDAIQSNNLSVLVSQKKARTTLYLNLRRLTDSLLNTSTSIDTSSNRINVVPPLKLSYKQFRTMVTIDTLKTVKLVQDKTFFKKVGDLFKRTDKNAAVDTATQFIKTEIKLDTTIQSKKFNNLQLANMNNYFRNLYASNNLLKKNEIDILELNNKIIKQIVSLLQTYKKREIDFTQQSKAALKNSIDNNFNSFDKFFIFSVSLLVLLVFVILYNIWKIFKNEGNLIVYGEKASQYAISKSRFLANMSHEIRTPLNSVVGFSEQLSQSKLNAQQLEQVNAIRSSSVMLLDVVNDILDFSKYEIGKVNFDKISFMPYHAISEVFNSIKIQAINKGIVLQKEISFDKSFCLSGDSLRLKQVVMNLLSNAIKFTDQGAVTLKSNIINISKKQNVLQVQIIDTGIGMEPEDLTLIFDEFAQVYYSATKNKQQGTGLGLAICKKIVEFQGGKIEVTSELGKGSIFNFEIPYDDCKESTEIKSENTIEINLNALKGKRILLVDDHKMNILLAKTVINKYGMITEVAYNGKEAIELFNQNNYDLILTDIQMPIMGGIELTRIIRANSDNIKSTIAILGVTANVLDEDRIKYLQSGIDDLVLKPFSEKDLIDKMAKYLIKVQL